MRTTAVVLGCIGGALLLVIGVPLTVAHPYGLLFVIAGVLGIVGGIKARSKRTSGGALLCIATALAFLPSVIGVLAGVGPAVTLLFFVPTILLLLATVFAFTAPLPAPPAEQYPPPAYPPSYPPR